MAAVCDLGNDPSEHGVAEELEALVGGLAADLGAPRAMGQCTPEQREVSEVVTDPSAQCSEVGRSVGRTHASRTRS